MVKNADKQHGFTIVELLIVIVVIGILAAIVIVAYNGVQGRAYDSSVKDDFRNVSQLLQNYQTTNGHLPANTTDLANAGIKVSKGAYDLTSTLSRNVGMCIVASPGNERYALLSLSKSGSWFTYDTTGTIAQYNKSSWPGNASPCTSSMGFSAVETGYWATFGAEQGAPNSGWYAWANG
jgi:general secretion pathway protein G